MSTSEARSELVGRAIPPAPVSHLSNATFFSSLVGELSGELKLGCQISNYIEADLIRLQWPAGMIYGSEAELSKRFQVGRAVIREAIRVLEVRGSARMRRGPNGGLQVLRPSRAQSVALAVDYVSLLSVSPAQVAIAQGFIDNIKRRLTHDEPSHDCGDSLPLQQIDTVALPFFEELIGKLGKSGDCCTQDDIRPSLHRTRAAQIARRLMAECTSRRTAEGMKLGSTLDLCERYATDRGVLRQAIRILESAGAVASLGGRGHGVVSQVPRPASVCRLISCHFAAHGLSTVAAMKLFHATSVEAAARMAQLAGPDDVARIHAALQKFENSPVTHVMFEVEESLTCTLDNPLIDLILLSTKAFSCWEISGSEDFVELDRVYLTETRKLADAIAQRDALGAAAAQDAKYRRLAEVWGHYVRADGAGGYYLTAC